MDLKKRNVAITAGLTAVLALSPVVAPVATAFAEGSDSTGIEAKKTVDTLAFKYMTAEGKWTTENWAVGSPVPSVPKADGYYEVTAWVAEDGSVVSTGVINAESNYAKYDVNGDGRVTFTAQYVAEPEKQTVTFVYTYGDGTVAASRDAEIVDGALVYDNEIPELDGYEFVGWTTDGGSTIISNGVLNDATNIVAGTTYTTVWAPVADDPVEEPDPENWLTSATRSATPPSSRARTSSPTTPAPSPSPTATSSTISRPPTASPSARAPLPRASGAR